VTRAIYVGVVTGSGVVFYVGGVDGDTTLTLFRCLVDLVEGESFTTGSNFSLDMIVPLN